MKLKDLPEYCESHYCVKPYGNRQTKCEYRNACRFYCHAFNCYSRAPVTWRRLLNDLEKDIEKDDEEILILDYCRTDADCITSLFRENTENHIAEHPEIFDGNKTPHDE